VPGLKTCVPLGMFYRYVTSKRRQKLFSHDLLVVGTLG
jgi:hypothetical protein